MQKQGWGSYEKRLYSPSFSFMWKYQSKSSLILYELKAFAQLECTLLIIYIAFTLGYSI